MHRREFFQKAGLGAAAVAATAAVAGAANAAPDPAAPHLPKEGKRKLPVNKQRAYAVLEKYQIDGIVALRPHNVFYLTNTWPVVVDFGTEFPALATFARDPAQPSFFIGTTGAAWEFNNGDREVPEFIAYSGVANWRDYINATPEQMKVRPQSLGGLLGSHGFAVKAGGPFSAREQAWADAQAKYNPKAEPSIEWGLVRALKESGLDRGRIAVDDMRIAYMLQKIGFDTVTVFPGDNIFREIRLIKQPHEIDIMRVSQLASQRAALRTAHALQPGMTYREARSVFTTEAAANGADIAFLLVGVTQGMLPDEVVTRGRSYMIDCGAYHHHYMGDFARTVSIGEPSATLKKRFAAQQIGRQAALEVIKPGAPFAMVEKTARDAMVKAGMPADVIAACNLHSVGMQHDDQPTRSDVPYRVRGDMVLEKNMCVTLDLPFLEVGWGAGHNEDLLLITDNGYELMNAPDEPLVVAA
jgi:Xaa-Pro aminopeptidase